MSEHFVASHRDELLKENRELKDRIKRLEGELMDVKNKHSVLVADVVLNEDRAERIKRLEEAGDAMVDKGWNEPHLAGEWRKSKEAKP